MASYYEWLKNLQDLSKTAQFCLSDVTERISVREKVLTFIITEAKGLDRYSYNSRSRNRQQVARPRSYVEVSVNDNFSSPRNRAEITEPWSNIRLGDFDFQDFWKENTKLCLSVVESLKAKISVMTERSVALLEAQLGPEVIKLITKKLEGEDIEDSGLKELLFHQLASSFEKHVVNPIKRTVKADPCIKHLEIEKDDLQYDYECTDGTFAFQLTWKEIPLYYRGMQSVGREPTSTVGGNHMEQATRDLFLFVVNLPSFGQMMVTKLKQIMEK